MAKQVKRFEYWYEYARYFMTYTHKEAWGFAFDLEMKYQHAEGRINHV